MNSRINVQEVRLIASNGDQVGVVDTSKALELAKEEDLDLVEIVPNQTPPVCRIMDYGKYKFESQKKAHAAKKKQKQTQVKEIKFRPSTDDGDFKIKLKKIKSFILDGDKTKISVRFRGREILNSEMGLNLLNKIKDELSDIAQVDQEPSLEGRQLLMIISPLKKKN